MLTPPPCLKGFIECDPGNTRHTGVDVPPSPSSSQGSVTIPPYQSSETSFTVPPSQSSKRSVTIPPSNSSSRSGIGLSSSTGNNNLFAVYRVTLRNQTKNPLKGLTLQHGPVPFGATFDPSRSEKSCSFVQKIVGCNQDAGDSETKIFPIIYKITNPAFCRISPVLQSIRTTYAQATNTAVPASASVQCTVMKGNELDRELAEKKALEDAKERALKNPRAVYTVSLKNLGSKALKDLSITHGPVPSGLSFDPTRSDSHCTLAENNVVCTEDLAASTSKEFQITYKVTDGSKCETTPILQTVKTSEERSIVTSTVHCANVENGTSDSGSGSNLSSSSVKPKNFIAEYTVTLKNLSRNVQNELVAHHGPVPSEATFDRTLSSRTCSGLGTEVSCKQALHAGEEKTFKILYAVSSPEDCESFASLKNITVTYEGTEETPPVSAWVQCTIRKSLEFLTQEDGADTLRQEYIGTETLPDTGYDNQYYQSHTEQGVILIAKQNSSDLPYGSFLLAGGISILLIGLAAFMKFPQQKGLKQAFYARF